MTAVSDVAPSITSLVLAVSLSLGDVAWAASESSEPIRVEVFTAQDLPIQPLRRGGAASAKITTEVYEIDGIARLEAIVSEQLPTEANAARRVALQRVSQADAVRIEQAQRAAVGLVRAAEYGIDRFPAMVFDGQAVVYGVTDIEEALHRYRLWHEAPVP